MCRRGYWVMAGVEVQVSRDFGRQWWEVMGVEHQPLGFCPSKREAIIRGIEKKGIIIKRKGGIIIPTMQRVGIIIKNV